MHLPYMPARLSCFALPPSSTDPPAATYNIGSGYQQHSCPCSSSQCPYRAYSPPHNTHKHPRTTGSTAVAAAHHPKQQTLTHFTTVNSNAVPSLLLLLLEQLPSSAAAAAASTAPPSAASAAAAPSPACPTPTTATLLLLLLPHSPSLNLCSSRPFQVLSPKAVLQGRSQGGLPYDLQTPQICRA